MRSCDVLVIGGGPAGSSCAAALRRAGADVTVVDRAAFPRDKPCAGWVTPQALATLDFDADEYRRGRTLQPFTAFRVGVIQRDEDVVISYGRPISFGIRRIEFDEYLLSRSGARVVSRVPVTSISRDARDWVVNGEYRAPMLVGAGGHFCPVAASLNPGAHGEPRSSLVLAQEAEIAIAGCPTSTASAEVPQLSFSRDLSGYGWCIRKGQYLNVGFGHVAGVSVPRAMSAFIEHLERRGTIPPGYPWHWHGRAYRLATDCRPRLGDEGVLLVGDAAGVAHVSSGEGIRPAIESGLLAARAILDAGGRCSGDDAVAYQRRIRSALAAPGWLAGLAARVPRDVSRPLGQALLRTPWFVRHIVLDRAFLRVHERPLSL